MTNEESAAERQPRYSRRRRLLYLVAALVLLVSAAVVVRWRPWRHDSSILPRDVTAQITTFTPYRPELLPAGLHVDPASVKFDGTLLVFRLSKPGATMVVTEQTTPPGLANQNYPSEKIDGVDGVAYLSRDGTRTFATLFARGQGDKPTMVLVNTNDPFTSDNFKDLVRGFRVVQ